MVLSLLASPQIIFLAVAAAFLAGSTKHLFSEMWLCGFCMRVDDETGSSDSLKNSAFVFVKPHANTAAVQELVREKLVSSGITILSEKTISGKTIDEKKLIDQHYYAIGKKPHCSLGTFSASLVSTYRGVQRPRQRYFLLVTSLFQPKNSKKNLESHGKLCWRRVEL